MREFFVNLCCSLVPIKKYRHALRERFATACPVIYNAQEQAVFTTSFHAKKHHTILLKNNVQLFGYNQVEQGVTIGRFSYLNAYTQIEGNTTIGRYCSIGINCLIGAEEHPTQFLSTSPSVYQHIPGAQPNGQALTSIGNDVWIGAHVIIKRGLKIGNGAVIGAGAVVTKDVPPYAMVGGVPAKILRFRFDKETINTLESLNWWNLPHEQILRLPLKNVLNCVSQLKKPVSF